jgi:NAD(P)-dependent dehydrogenase (short-subunit alcohol dehydrogenase family)
MDKILTGKLALVTGSSRGIGQQIACGLAQLGCKVIVHGRYAQNLEKTIKELHILNAEYAIAEGELTIPGNIDRFTRKLIKKYGHVDILYNNAALMTSYTANIWQHSWKNWETTFQANVFSVYRLCSAFVPQMITNGYGRVINLTSGIKHAPELAPYGASKAAIDKLTDDLSVRLINTGVSVSTLDPGWLKTDMGGQNAEHPVQKVLPGALIPALIDAESANGKFFSAINYDHSLALEFNLGKIKPVI